MPEAPPGMKQRRTLGLVLVINLILGGCTAINNPNGKGPSNEDMTFDQMVQTDFNRTVTIAMRDNLDSLKVLTEKLYRRNPNQWRKTTAENIEEAIKRSNTAIDARTPPSALRGLSDIQILSVSLDPTYPGDRVAAFVYGLADTIIRAHNGKTRFYVTDSIDAQHVFNAARNVEIAAWLLATRKDKHNQPLLLANEIGPDGTNLSFEREFGQIIGRLDLIANLMDENLRRVGINYVQGLLFFNFLPVR
ncbi:hypothetical protein [Neopusillimonas aestuarii]|uniref:hypothetical protein n=1 Tax=Neopusillimonas aestuarii TaxID=2716226 RepID=UPI001D1811FB|nr:hypothetical protein [Pusillimonas sp. DMV24BSW_D]